jgi:hypothetical protein
VLKIADYGASVPNAPPAVPQHVWEQIGLPGRFGGAGIALYTAQHSAAARLAAAALADAALQGGASRFLTLTGALGPAYAALWASLHDHCSDPDFLAGMSAAGLRTPVWAPEHRAISPEVIEKVLPSAQKAFHRAEAAHRSQALLASLDPALQRRDLARIRSLCCRPAGIWMDTTPYHESVRLGDYEVSSGLRHLLGLPYLPLNAPSMLCACARRVYVEDYDHFMVCGTQASRHFLHERVAIATRDLIKLAGMASSREPRIRDLPGGTGARHAERPGARADVILNLEPHGITALDISIIHPSADSYSLAAAVTPGAAAARRDAQKTAAYATADPNGYHFIPFTVESYGRLGKPAMQFLKKLAEVAARAPGVHAFDESRFVEGALRTVSVAVCKGVAMLGRQGAQRFPANFGLNYAPGLDHPAEVASP